MAREERKDLILKAAEKMLRGRRFHEVTLDEIAAAAHVGKGTIYRYFKNKDDLFFQLAAHGHDELCQAVSALGRQGSGQRFEERLVRMCGQISSFHAERRNLLRVMGEHEARLQALRRGDRKVFEERKRELRAAVGEVLAVGQKEGSIRPDIPLEMQAHLLLSLLRARSPAFAPNPDRPPPIELVVDVFLRGVQAGRTSQEESADETIRPSGEENPHTAAQ